MDRCFFLVLCILLAYFINLGYCSTNKSSKFGAYEEYGTRTIQSSPLKSDIAFAFFREAERLVSYNSSGNPDDKVCLDHLEKIYEGILNYEEWALQWPDSWGRLPMGLFWGHVWSFGGFEECIAATRDISATETIKGKYCLSAIPIKDLYSKVKPRQESSLMQPKISYKHTDPQFFELGICVPKTCSAQFTNAILKEVVAQFSIVNIEKPMVVEERCRTDDPIELRGIDIFAIVFICCIVAAMILSSFYDAAQQKKGEEGRPLLTAFSVYTNAPKIFTVKKTNNPNVINCLNGMRCISMLWVVFGHGYMTYYDLPHINKNRFYTWTQTPYSMLVQNATLCVDTFFFMSGLLMLWGTFREMERSKGKLNIPLMYFHRYIRLTPVVAVVILYIMSLYKYSGHGPMWIKIGTQDKRCEHTWWATLLYVQNYVYPRSICVSQSWYLAVDTQLYVLSPLFIIPLWKWGKKVLAPIVLFGILCMGCTFATFMYNDFTLFRVQDDHVDLRQKLTYYPTHTRVPTWLTGVIFGYFFYKYNRGRKIHLEKKLVFLGWFVALGTMLACIWGPYWRILPQYSDAPIIEGAFYEPLSRASWACAIAWIVWACYNGHGGVIDDFLSWSFFQGFARLTYCMYVIHRIVQLVNGGRIQHDTYFNDYEALLRFWHDFGIALTASIFATLAFEAPILGIEKAMFGNHKGSPTPQKPKAEVSQITKPTEEIPPIIETKVVGAPSV